ncbi:hypothetical protein Skr01_54280 [Sphaerisporangium krabiense]|uniref:Uncharacterized protein n=1 Tax=Sphaerisporangium krabiense TaxID=763782 RepID=A0A7W8Z4C7_9ACTN|nr:hypothetical protein [Sphaerisporangium krabiense]MBB5627185.1 hypothetical protein [Sphaerisporangium krabiense]GII65343.1 hypothetical protein Skr01_54280 [Sphaerisporangium krabiense]
MDHSVGQDGQAVHVVVTCTNRKRIAVADELRVRNVLARDVDERCDQWVRHISTAPAQVPASDMYAGEHWLIARRLAEIVGEKATLWVCSAGYGLIPVTTPIAPYAATFALGHGDSVAANAEGARRWWARLSRWVGPQRDQPRSFVALAARDPDATIIAVLSDPYLKACSTDLRGATSVLSDGDSLSVIGPAGRCPEIDDLMVPVTAALRAMVGGSLLSLNVRAAEYVLKESALRGDALQRPLLAKIMRDVIASVPDAPYKPAGTRMTDDEVRVFIRSRLEFGPTSATPLLRELRSSGRSCEHARFRNLFVEESRAAAGEWG